MKKNVKKDYLPLIELKGKGKLVVSKKLKEQIDYLHKKVGGDEWSGMLLYKIVEGDITSPKGLVIHCEDMFLMDIGSSTFTEYDFEAKDVDELYKYQPLTDPVKMIDDLDNMLNIGLIHTHHSMGAYFSATDMEELQDNAPNHDKYVSLVVDFKETYDAKICYIVEQNPIYKIKNTKDKTLELAETKKFLTTIDLDVSIESDDVIVDAKIVDRYNDLKTKATRAAASKSTTTKSVYDFQCATFLMNLLRKGGKKDTTYKNINDKKKSVAESLKTINKAYKKMKPKSRKKYILEYTTFIKEAVSDAEYGTGKVSLETISDYVDVADNLLGKIAKEFNIEDLDIVIDLSGYLIDYFNEAVDMIYNSKKDKEVDDNVYHGVFHNAADEKEAKQWGMSADEYYRYFVGQ